jgi:hypothetical protein
MSVRARFEAAVPAGEDPVRYAALLSRVRDAALAGEPRPAAPRPVIDDSWRRTIDFGVDPDHGRDLDQPVDRDEVEHRRRDSPLGRVVPVLADLLMPAAEDAGHVMVVVDADGTILWRDGPGQVQRRAEDLGFTRGANWSERAVGTNAIGTALAVERPVQVYSAEHFVRSHHEWTCAAAPIRDPASGQMLGVVDVSGAAATVHPSTLALVDAAARMAEQHLRVQHLARLSGLRATAAPVLSRTGGRAVVTDEHGWIAASVGLAVDERVSLPDVRATDRVWVPALGSCLVEPLPGGWLLRVLDGEHGETAPTRAVLDLADPRRARLVVDAASGRWTSALSPRHAELLVLLAEAGPAGRSAADLSAALFGGGGHEIAVRAEFSRLRRTVGGLLVARPYRFADWVAVTVRRPWTD